MREVDGLDDELEFRFRATELSSFCCSFSFGFQKQNLPQNLYPQIYIGRDYFHVYLGREFEILEFQWKKYAVVHKAQFQKGSHFWVLQKYIVHLFRLELIELRNKKKVQIYPQGCTSKNAT